MIKLEKDLHPLALRAISGVPINHLFALSVIQNKAAGDVFVDSLVNPKAFYVKHPYGMSLLFGEPGVASFSDALQTYLTDEKHIRKADEWLQVFPLNWSRDIPVLRGASNHPDKSLEMHERVNFTFEASRYRAIRAKTLSLNDGVTVVRTNQSIFSEKGGSVIPWYFWKNSDDFVQNGVGYTVMDHGIPASTAFSAFVHEPFLELGIETAESYRGNGYAYEACSALIEHCLAKDYEPVWACRGGNIGSMKLAEKLGFAESARIPYYRFKPAATGVRN